MLGVTWSSGWVTWCKRLGVMQSSRYEKGQIPKESGLFDAGKSQCGFVNVESPVVGSCGSGPQ